MKGAYPGECARPYSDDNLDSDVYFMLYRMLDHSDFRALPAGTTYTMAAKRGPVKCYLEEVTIKNVDSEEQKYYKFCFRVNYFTFVDKRYTFYINAQEIK